ncbi:MAG: hypothetical protein HY064_13215 [Bacteroidetes bacterium]|nr:hypothetical protein [Bacteroidota bacterium]
MPYFQFKYMTNTCTANIDDFTVATTTGPFVKKNFAFNDILNFYYQQKSTLHSIIITYNDANGKKKKTMMYANPGEPGIQQLNAYLMEKIPGKSVNGLSEKEAYRAMAISNPAKLAMVLVFVIMTAILGVVLFPGLTHYFDYGFQQVQVNDVALGKISGSRNVVIQGGLVNAGEEETVTSTNRGSTTVTHTTYVPIVGDEWKEGDPVAVVLKFNELSDADYNAALAQHSFVGVIRNVWWEGIGSDKVNYLKEHFQLNIPSKPVLIEVTNQEHNDAYAIWVFGGIEAVVLIILVIAAVKNK